MTRRTLPALLFPLWLLAACGARDDSALSTPGTVVAIPTLEATAGTTIVAAPVVSEVTATPTAAPPTPNRSATATVTPTATGAAPSSATPPSTPTSAPLPTASPSAAATATLGAPAVNQRLQFAPGTDSIRVNGLIDPGVPHTYVLGASAGQRLEVDVASTDGAVRFQVMGFPDGTIYKRLDDGLTNWWMQLPATQDYLVTLDATASASYTLDVAIPATTEAAAPTRIAFEAGAISGSAAGRVEPEQSVTYVAWAAAGQTMTVTIASPGGEANFSLSGASDGQVYKGFEIGDRQWTGVLPQAQDYVISVGTTGAATDFTLTITIQ